METVSRDPDRGGRLRLRGAAGGAPVLCQVSLEGPEGQKLELEVPDAALAAGGIQEGDTVLQTAAGLEKVKPIRTSALIGLGALGILFGRKMPGVQVIADARRAARYAAEPVLCNGQPCAFSYCAPEEGKPVDLILVTVKATGLEAAIRDLKAFVGPDTVILSLLNGITSEEKIEAAYPGHTLWSVAIGMDANRKGRQLVFKSPARSSLGKGRPSDCPGGSGGPVPGSLRHCRGALHRHPLQAVA